MSRFFQLSEIALEIWACKLTVCQYQYQVIDVMSLFLKNSLNVEGIEILADANGYYVYLILL